MKEVKPYEEHPKCPKCSTLSPQVPYSWGADAKGDYEWLKVTCSECGYTWNMETADSGKKQVILEEPGDHIPEKSALDLLKENEKVLKEDDETKLAPVGGVVKE